MVCDPDKTLTNSSRFMLDLTRISASNYIPIPEDMLRAAPRKPEPTSIVIGDGPNRNIRFIVPDDGQRTYGKKWLHTLDNVSTIVFMVSLTCYDLAREADRNGVSCACREVCHY
jgi:hypothetical protein